MENTLIVVTGDNGMSFPRAKANVYEYGVHGPMAASWPAVAPGGRTGDPRILGVGDIFETYKRYSPIREFPAPDGE